MKIQKKYYLRPSLTKAVAFMALCEGISQSAWVERALRRFLRKIRG